MAGVVCRWLHPSWEDDKRQTNPEHLMRAPARYVHLSSIIPALLCQVSAATAAEPALPPSVMEQVVSLNGPWTLEPSGGQALEAMIPGFWERIPGWANVHVVTYRRNFDIPTSFARQRVRP